MAIPTINDTYPVAPLENLFNLIGDAAEADDAAGAAALTAALAVRQIRTWRWANAAARTATVGMVAGDEGYQIDTKVYYQYDGTAWRAVVGGLVPIVPTSVTGGTVTAGGKITFSASAAVVLNGVFSANFENYRIIGTIESRTAVGDAAIQLTAGGTPVGTNYGGSRMFWNGSAVTGGTMATGSYVIDIGGSRAQFAHDIFGPFLTAGTGFNGGSSGPTFSANQGGQHSLATSYDGFRIIPLAGGTLTGSLKVYGYNGD